MAHPLSVFGVASKLPTLRPFVKLKCPLLFDILDFQLLQCGGNLCFAHPRKLVRRKFILGTAAPDSLLSSRTESGFCALNRSASITRDKVMCRNVLRSYRALYRICDSVRLFVDFFELAALNE